MFVVVAKQLLLSHSSRVVWSDCAHMCHNDYNDIMFCDVAVCFLNAGVPN